MNKQIHKFSWIKINSQIFSENLLIKKVLKKNRFWIKIVKLLKKKFKFTKNHRKISSKLLTTNF